MFVLVAAVGLAVGIAAGVFAMRRRADADVSATAPTLVASDGRSRPGELHSLVQQAVHRLGRPDHPPAS